MSFTPAKRTALLAALLLILLTIAFFIWSAINRHQLRTDDAVVTADYTLVAPKVSGYIRTVNVADNQQVTAGEVLATIDDRDYRVALETARANLQVSEAKQASIQAQLEQQKATIAQADAAVSASQATLNYAGQNADRYRRLLKSGTATADEQQKSSATMLSAAAEVKQSQAAVLAAHKEVAVLQASLKQAQADSSAMQASVDQALLNLSYTRITAPISGSVGQRAVRQGAWVSAGTRLLAVVPLKQSYVVANFLETQLANVTAGQPVSLTVDALPGVTLRGHVDSIAPATGSTFAAITADNATGNYTKVVQRLPVKIVLEPGQSALDRLRVGMSVVPELERQ
ncbi:MAG TPA: HlyD family secretion protein [Erwinia persicina]|uniref:HlyD family secretion protein n=1 Tax=Erwinia persicina TaxID=55211 RepID=A0A356YR65_9GAMM|nr:HlyD family secretion protein [Erwinia persicina]AXU94169.1 HlyD family secretion protein [Erwinia persicina]MBC3946201.1 HlyD family secretion protein [Erwinia persicina]MBD8108850.1 HlyD family secretion protein [Erwinia persicina]MBD8169955.1 HlyD family secretion protein [Erwinia persicina]MBD8211949.1 HlyD family secretion protein [Erwinia persicina]